MNILCLVRFKLKYFTLNEIDTQNIWYIFGSKRQIMELNPQYYGLSSRVELKDLGQNKIGILKVIKSRIIQKDALKIVDLAKQITQVDSTLKVVLVCTRNICSKSLALLEKQEIELMFVD